MNYQKLEKTSMCYRCKNKEICKTVYQADDCGIQLSHWDCSHFAEPEPQGKWIPVSERLPEEKLFNPSGSDFGFDFEEVLCTTIWGDVRAYKFGKPEGHEQAHFWLAGGIMDEYVIAWQPLPEPYMKGGAE